jgi:hypothetical protein
VVENVGYYGFRPTPTQHRDPLTYNRKG